MLNFISIWCLLCILATLLPFFPSDHYLIRGWDFPILQLAVLTLVGIFGLSFYSPFSYWQYALLFSTLLAFCYQVRIIFPYTFIASIQVEKSTNYEESRSIKLLSSNVLRDNSQTEKLQQVIADKTPDVVLLLEPDDWWADAMNYLDDDYPYSEKIPLDNFYGMILFSRFPLKNTEQHYLIEPDVPSIFTSILLPSGEKVKLYCVHPKPPSPTENKESTERDAELLLVAKIAEKESLPTVVMGDLNDVAWSHTTRLFQKISGLLDPRIGRRPYATFNANYPIFRWPLDHFFHSQDFQLVHIERLPHIGSDHFPIFIHLALKEKAKSLHDKPTATGQEKEEATEKIQEGVENVNKKQSN